MPFGFGISKMGSLDGSSWVPRDPISNFASLDHRLIYKYIISWEHGIIILVYHCIIVTLYH